MYNLRFKYGTSRGRDSYGYGICSLFVDGKKVASCNGGGYDMKGTSFGHWVARQFEAELLKLKIPMSRRNGENVREYYGLTFHDPNYDPGKAKIEGETVAEREKAGKSLGLERYQAFYHESSRVPTKRHTIPLIDGACGFSCVERILEAVGYGLKYVADTSTETHYLCGTLEQIKAING